MGADQDIDLTLLEPFVDGSFFLGGAEAVHVVDRDAELGESFFKGFGVLEGQNGSGYKHGHLLAVYHGLKGTAHGNFGLAEAHVAADKTVHGVRLDHVFLDLLGSRQLVGGVFVHEARFELVLQVAVGWESVAGGGLALGVELDELARHVLHLFLGAALQVAPGVATDLAQGRWSTFLAGVLADLVQAVDTHVKHVVVFIKQPHALLNLPIHLDLLETAVAPYPVIDVYHEIAGLELAQHAGAHGGIFAKAPFQAWPVKTLENLVIRVGGHLTGIIHVTRVQRQWNRVKFHLGVHVLKDGVETLELFGVTSKEVIGQALFGVLLQVFNEQLEILIKTRLWFALELDAHRLVLLLTLQQVLIHLAAPQRHQRAGVHVVHHLRGPDKGAVAKNLGQVALVKNTHGVGKLSGFLKTGLELIEQVLKVAHPKHGVVGQHVEQADLLVLLETGVDVGHDTQAPNVGGTQLRFRIEGANALDVFVE